MSFPTQNQEPGLLSANQVLPHFTSLTPSGSLVSSFPTSISKDSAGIHVLVA